MGRRAQGDALASLQDRMEAAAQTGVAMFHPACSVDEVEQAIFDGGHRELDPGELAAFEQLSPGAWRAAFRHGWESARELVARG